MMSILHEINQRRMGEDGFIIWRMIMIMIDK